MPTGRLLLFRVGLLLVASVLSLGSGELALRVIYRDGGRTTSRGPGRNKFEYEYAVQYGPHARGPKVQGSKPAGVQRIAIYGDSITWGVGVRDWRLTYPVRLLERLSAGGTRFDMHVMARAGLSVDTYARWAAVERNRLDPDFVIYQWYVNDLEIARQHPGVRRVWHEWSGHRWLGAHSYLYYFLDNRLTQLLPPTSHHYTDFLARTFVEGTTAWARFRDALHRWIVYSTANGERALIFLYPQVPFEGVNPLAQIHARIQALRGRTDLRYPASMCPGDVGEIVRASDTIDRRLRRSLGTAGPLIRCPDVPFLPGHYRLTARLRLDRSVPPSSSVVAVLKVTVGDGFEVSQPIDRAFARTGEWGEGAIDFDVTRGLTHVHWKLDVPRATFMSVDQLTVPVTYDRLDVLDLSDRLNTFNTHVSLFDAHPNARAHAVIAETLAQWIEAHAHH